MPTVLEEHFDEDYEPTHQEIEAYAHSIGMDLEVDSDLLWIVKEALKARLPYPWKACGSDDGQVFYFNFETGESVWEHPNDTHYMKMYEEKRCVGKNSISDMHQVVAKLRDESHALYQRNVFLFYCNNSFSEELRQLHGKIDSIYDRIDELEAERSALCSAIDETDAWERTESKVVAEVVAETPEHDDAQSVLHNSNAVDVQHALEKKGAELKELEGSASIVKAAIQERTEDALLASKSLMEDEALLWPCCPHIYPSGLKVPENKLNSPRMRRVQEDLQEACKRQPGGSCRSCFRKEVAAALAAVECSSKPDGSKLSDLSRLKNDISERVKHVAEDNCRLEKDFLKQLETHQDILDSIRPQVEEKRNEMQALEAEVTALSQRYAASSQAHAAEGEATRQTTEAIGSAVSNSALPSNTQSPHMTKSGSAALGDEDSVNTVNNPKRDLADAAESKACTNTDTAVISVLKFGGDSFEVKLPLESTVAELRDRIAAAWELRSTEIKLVADEVVPQLHQTVASLTGSLVACACVAPEDILKGAGNEMRRLHACVL